MKLLELRREPSRNKKWQYIYKVIDTEGNAIAQRKSDIPNYLYVLCYSDGALSFRTSINDVHKPEKLTYIATRFNNLIEILTEEQLLILICKLTKI